MNWPGGASGGGRNIARGQVLLGGLVASVIVNGKIATGWSESLRTHTSVVQRAPNTPGVSALVIGNKMRSYTGSTPWARPTPVTQTSESKFKQSHREDMTCSLKNLTSQSAMV